MRVFRNAHTCVNKLTPGSPTAQFGKSMASKCGHNSTKRPPPERGERTTCAAKEGKSDILWFGGGAVRIPCNQRHTQNTTKNEGPKVVRFWTFSRMWKFIFWTGECPDNGPTIAVVGVVVGQVGEKVRRSRVCFSLFSRFFCFSLMVHGQSWSDPPCQSRSWPQWAIAKPPFDTRMNRPLARFTLLLVFGSSWRVVFRRSPGCVNCAGWCIAFYLLSSFEVHCVIVCGNSFRCGLICPPLRDSRQLHPSSTHLASPICASESEKLTATTTSKRGHRGILCCIVQMTKSSSTIKSATREHNTETP